MRKKSSEETGNVLGKTNIKKIGKEVRKKNSN